MAAFWQALDLAAHYFYVYYVMATEYFEKFDVLMISVLNLGEKSKAVIASFP